MFSFPSWVVPFSFQLPFLRLFSLQLPLVESWFGMSLLRFLPLVLCLSFPSWSLLFAIMPKTGTSCSHHGCRNQPILQGQQGCKGRCFPLLETYPCKSKVKINVVEVEARVERSYLHNGNIEEDVGKWVLDTYNHRSLCVTGILDTCIQWISIIK